jgi:hypothetical protein
MFKSADQAVWAPKLDRVTVDQRKGVRHCIPVVGGLKLLLGTVVPIAFNYVCFVIRHSGTVSVPRLRVHIEGVTKSWVIRLRRYLAHLQVLRSEPLLGRSSIDFQKWHHEG